MQPRGLGVELTECKRTARQEAPKPVAEDYLSPQHSALHLADRCFLLKDCCASLSVIHGSAFSCLSLNLLSFKTRGSPGGASGKRTHLPMRETCGFDHWWRRSPGEGSGNPLQCSCLENPMDRGAWQATVHGVAQSQTWVKWLGMSEGTHAYISVIFLFVQRETSSGR